MNGAYPLHSLQGKSVEAEFQRLRILLVEDDEFSARVVAALCDRCNYEVTIVQSAEKALEKLVENAKLPPERQLNLVLSDIVMQGMSGKELLWHMRHVLGSDICIVMVSSQSSRHLVEECIMSGADSYLVKPVRLEDIARLWHVVMHHHITLLNKRQATLEAVQREGQLRLLQQQAEMHKLRAETEAERERSKRERLEIAAEKLRLQHNNMINRQRERMQQQMLRLLHTKMRQYWQLAQMCNDLILHASRQGVFLYVSLKCKRMLGYSPDELDSSRETLGCIHKDDMAELQQLVAKAEAGDPQVAEGMRLTLRLQDKEGCYVPLRLPMYPVSEPGEGRSIIGALPSLHRVERSSRGVPAGGEASFQAGEEHSTAHTRGR